jgi:hypothetical protein
MDADGKMILSAFVGFDRRLLWLLVFDGVLQSL